MSFASSEVEAENDTSKLLIKKKSKPHCCIWQESKREDVRAHTHTGMQMKRCEGQKETQKYALLILRWH